MQLNATGDKNHNGLNEKRTWDRHWQLLIEEFGITSTPVVDQALIWHYQNVVNKKATFDD